jgi:hypothetical protein
MAAARTRRTVKMIIMTRTLACRNPAASQFLQAAIQLKMITEPVALNVPSAPRLSAPPRARLGEAYGRA